MLAESSSISGAGAVTGPSLPEYPGRHDTRAPRPARRPHPPGRRGRRRPRRRAAARHPRHRPALPHRRRHGHATSGSPASSLPAAGHRAPPALVVPRLEAPGFAHLPLDDLGVEVVTWQDGEDPYLLVSDLAGGPTRIAVADTMPAVHVFGLQEALPDADAEPGRPGRCASCGCARTRPRSTSCAPRAPRSTACTPGWASSLKAGRTEAQVGGGHRRGDRRGGPRGGGVRHRRLGPERREPAPRRVATG